MKRTLFAALVIILFVLAATPGLVCGQAISATDGVICRTNRSLQQRSGELTLLTAEMTMEGGIKVLTNGTFRVDEGKARRLKEGQILRSDGYLLNPDGSIMPVCDHIAMSAATVMVVKDGEGAALTAPLTLPDGSVINPDGTYTRPGGHYSRLVDGQLLTLEGASMSGLDTITLSNGKVVVYKSGAFIHLQSPVQIMGMYDGSRVRGDGLVTYKDGTTTQLTEGKTVTVEGVRAGW